jgi:hypothetical protein
MQTSPHYGDSPASACPADHVKVVTWLWRCIWIDSFHKVLEDHEGGQTADAAAVESQQSQILVRHEELLKGFEMLSNRNRHDYSENLWCENLC